MRSGWAHPFAFVLMAGVACGGQSVRVTPEDEATAGAGRAGVTTGGGGNAGHGSSRGGGGGGPARGGASGSAGGVAGRPGMGAAGTGTGGRGNAGGAGSGGSIATDAGEGGAAGDPGGVVTEAVDIVHTDLSIDLDARAGTARLTLAPTGSATASFETGDLEILSVTSNDVPLAFDATRPARLEVALPVAATPLALTIDYRFHDHEHRDGYSAAGYTFTWPYSCGNVFPCHSDPADGMTFELNVRGGAGTFVYPRSVANEAPSYMLAWIQGDYTEISLGTTAAGTEVSVYYRPGTEVLTDVLAGTASLRTAFSWLESSLGPYPFGTKVASVSAPWSGGGMEHHPYWHVASDQMGDPLTHVHEAAHGWFGDGVRLRCWEDLVLSEGTVSYLAARALESAGQKTSAAAAWQSYEVAAFATDTPWASSWPTTCGEGDVLHDGFYSRRMYARGALFFRALEGRIGRVALDRTLSDFYRAWVGKAVTFEALLTAVAEATGYDPLACAVKWLRTDEVPSDVCE